MNFGAFKFCRADRWPHKIRNQRKKRAKEATCQDFGIYGTLLTTKDAAGNGVNTLLKRRTRYCFGCAPIHRHLPKAMKKREPPPESLQQQLWAWKDLSSNMEKKLAFKDNEISELEEKLTTRDDQLSKCQRELEYSLRKISALESQCIDKSQRILQLSQNRKTDDVKWESLKGTWGNLTGKQNDIEGLNLKLEKSEIELEKIRTHCDSLEKENISLTERLDESSMLLDTLQQERGKNNKKLRDLSDVVRTLNRVTVSYEKEAVEVVESTDLAHAQAIQNVKRKIEAMEEHRHNLLAECQQLRDENEAQKAKIEAMESHFHSLNNSPRKGLHSNDEYSVSRATVEQVALEQSPSQYSVDEEIGRPDSSHDQIRRNGNFHRRKIVDDNASYVSSDSSFSTLDPPDIRQEEFEGIKADYEDALEEMFSLREQLEDSQLKVRALEQSASDQHDYVNRCEFLENEYADIQNQFATLQNDLSDARSKIQELKRADKEKHRRYLAEIVEADQESQDLREQLEAVKKEFSSELESIEAEVEAARESFDNKFEILKAGHAKELEALLNEYNEFKTKHTSSMNSQKKQFSDLDCTYKLLKETYENMQKEMETLKAKNDKSNDSKTEQSLAIDTLKKRYDGLKEAHEKLEDELETLKLKYDASLWKIVTLEDQLDTSKAEITKAQNTSKKLAENQSGPGIAEMKKSAERSRAAMQEAIRKYQNLRQESRGFKEELEQLRKANADQAEKVEIDGAGKRYGLNDFTLLSLAQGERKREVWFCQLLHQARLRFVHDSLHEATADKVKNVSSPSPASETKDIPEKLLVAFMQHSQRLRFIHESLYQAKCHPESQVSPVRVAKAPPVHKAPAVRKSPLQKGNISKIILKYEALAGVQSHAPVQQAKNDMNASLDVSDMPPNVPAQEFLLHSKKMGYVHEALLKNKPRSQNHISQQDGQYAGVSEIPPYAPTQMFLHHSKKMRTTHEALLDNKTQAQNQISMQDNFTPQIAPNPEKKLQNEHLRIETTPAFIHQLSEVTFASRLHRMNKLRQVHQELGVYNPSNKKSLLACDDFVYNILRHQSKLSIVHHDLFHQIDSRKSAFYWDNQPTFSMSSGLSYSTASMSDALSKSRDENLNKLVNVEESCEKTTDQSSNTAKIMIEGLRLELRRVKLAANAAKIRHRAREKELRVVHFQYEKLQEEHDTQTGEHHLISITAETVDDKLSQIESEPSPKTGQENLSEDLVEAQQRIEEKTLELQRTKDHLIETEKQQEKQEKNLSDAIAKVHAMDNKSSENQQTSAVDPKSVINSVADEGCDGINKVDEESQHFRPFDRPASSASASSVSSRKCDLETMQSFDGSILTSLYEPVMPSTSPGYSLRSAEGRDETTVTTRLHLEDAARKLAEDGTAKKIKEMQRELDEAKDDATTAKKKYEERGRDLRDVIYQYKRLKSEYDDHLASKGKEKEHEETGKLPERGLGDLRMELDAAKSKVCVLEDDLAAAKKAVDNARGRQKQREEDLKWLVSEYKHLQEENENLKRDLEARASTGSGRGPLEHFHLDVKALGFRKKKSRSQRKNHANGQDEDEDVSSPKSKLDNLGKKILRLGLGGRSSSHSPTQPK